MYPIFRLAVPFSALLLNFIFLFGTVKALFTDEDLVLKVTLSIIKIAVQ